MKKILFAVLLWNSLIVNETEAAVAPLQGQNNIVQDEAGFLGLGNLDNLVPNPLNRSRQAPGIAVFIVGNQPSQVYGARKIDGDPGNYNFNMITNSIAQGPDLPDVHHTEKQLVVRVLRDAGRNDGQLLVRMNMAPCGNANIDNGGRNCFNFYRDLAVHYNQLNIGVYFPDIQFTRIANAAFSEQDAFERLRRFLLHANNNNFTQALANGVNQPNPNNPRIIFQGGEIRFRLQNQLRNLDDIDEERHRIFFINLIRVSLNNLNNNNKQNVLNAVFGIPNRVQYHLR